MEVADNTGTAFQLPFGKLYKVLNPKWVFLAALLVFEIGSVVCGAAPTSTGLIIGVSFHLLPFSMSLPHVPGASEPRFASSSQTGKNIRMWKTNGLCIARHRWRGIRWRFQRLAGHHRALDAHGKTAHLYQYRWCHVWYCFCCGTSGMCPSCIHLTRHASRASPDSYCQIQRLKICVSLEVHLPIM